MVEKNYCMSSYLALKYVEDPKKDFFPGIKHNNYLSPTEKDFIAVGTACEIEAALEEQIRPFRDKKIGVFLSGGMDSAIVASYLRGNDAYTFRYVGINYPEDELRRAEAFADYYEMKLHYVDITWDSMCSYLDTLMKHKGTPVYYIEPQLHQAALQAKADGVDLIMVGEGSDLVFGGLAWLLSKDWTVEEFMNIYISTRPEDVLVAPESMQEVFNRYRLANNKMDFLGFIRDVFTIDAYTAYDNAFSVACIPFFDPFERLIMSHPLDLERIRKGEAKYLIRELFTMRYPTLPIPDKIRLPNPLDTYMQNWNGPKRCEFSPTLDIQCLKGKHKWQLYCLERFLDLYDPQ